jgi:NAD-dependent dihydropyrimidine dehydrogenase PreA subunit
MAGTKARRSGTAEEAECRQAPGTIVPVINTHKCEGAGDCVVVCPHDVFEMRKLTAAELKALPLGPWIKVLVHGSRQAFAVNPEACQACGLCVAACPEKAIKLARNVATVTP